MSEAALWELVRSRIAPYGHIVRHENRVGDGTPDVSYTIQGVGGWIELKLLDTPPKRSETPIHIPHLTKDQVLWAKKEAEAGGRMWMLLKVGAAFALCNAGLEERIFQRVVTMEDLRREAAVVGHRKFPHEDVLRCLVR